MELDIFLLTFYKTKKMTKFLSNYCNCFSKNKNVTLLLSGIQFKFSEQSLTTIL